MQIGRTILPPTVKTTNFQCETLREDTSTYIFCFPLEQSLARTTDSGRVVRRFGSNPVGHRTDKSREVGISSGNQALTRWTFVPSLKVRLSLQVCRCEFSAAFHGRPNEQVLLYQRAPS